MVEKYDATGTASLHHKLFFLVNFPHFATVCPRLPPCQGCQGVSEWIVYIIISTDWSL